MRADALGEAGRGSHVLITPSSCQPLPPSPCAQPLASGTLSPAGWVLAGGRPQSCFLHPHPHSPPVRETLRSPPPAPATCGPGLSPHVDDALCLTRPRGAALCTTRNKHCLELLPSSRLTFFPSRPRWDPQAGAGTARATPPVLWETEQ